MNTDEKELVWLPKALANKVQDIAGAEGVNREILQYIEDTKRDLRVGIESIEEDILLYRAQMIKARDSFKKAKEEELDANYKLWEDYDIQLSEVRSRISNFREELKPLKQDLDQIKQQMDSINKWGIEDLIKSVKVLNDNLYGETGNILKFLFENYKK